MIKAIQTKYKGILYRSRLEARWATFFDTLKVRIQYEHEGFELDGMRYLPDFYLPELKCYIEVKGQKPTKQEQELAFLLSKDSGMPVHIFSGSVPEPGIENWDDSGFEIFTYDFSKKNENMRYQLYQKDIYAINQCPKCESIGFSKKGITGLLPCGCGVGPRTATLSPLVARAYRNARMARF
jgi:hypothetical protein